MIFIVPAILLSILLLLLFKAFPARGVHTFSAIVFNYLFAALSGAVLSFGAGTVAPSMPAQAFYLAIPLGALFLGVFHLMSLTTQRISVSAASVANKMSVIIPFCFSIFVLHQVSQSLMWLGVALALAAVYLTSLRSGDGKVKAGSLYLPLLLFIGSGTIDTAINAANAWWVHGKDASALFSMTIFLSAFVFGCVTVVLMINRGKMKKQDFLNKKSLLAGALLGIPNYFSIYFIFLSLESQVLPSSRLFPLLNVANVALSALTGFLVFKEKLSLTNMIGILLAILSIFLLSK